jgi:hypothetical protein
MARTKATHSVAQGLASRDAAKVLKALQHIAALGGGPDVEMKPAPCETCTLHAPSFAPIDAELARRADGGGLLEALACLAARDDQAVREAALAALAVVVAAAEPDAAPGALAACALEPVVRKVRLHAALQASSVRQ